MSNGNEYVNQHGFIRIINENFKAAGISAVVFIDTKSGGNEAVATDRICINIERDGHSGSFMLYSSESVISITNYLKGFNALASLLSGKYNFRPMNLSSYEFERKSIIIGGALENEKN